jgi:hypothetical protein
MSKIVKFSKPLENYATDDAACFEDGLADKIIAAGFGEEISLESTKLENNSKKK